MCLILTGLVLNFQNCSNANFGSEDQASASGNTDDISDPAVDAYGHIDGQITEGANGYITETGAVDNFVIYPKADILFVVDESISMNTVIQQVRQGFVSVSQQAYPGDSKIAVMNMSPAYVNADSSINFSQPFVTKVSGLAHQPGFLKLVSRAGIQNYKNQIPADAAKFPLPGCAAQWFQPQDTDASGANCLLGATQLALQPIGVEAGIVSLFQMAKRQTSLGAKLFRDRALVNVVYVSDTHDPGAGYYDQPGAYATIPTLAQLKTVILANNPSILDLKINGIVPLPTAGSLLLTGLNVVGTLPSSSSVSGESTNGFSYLNLIKESGGVALHPIGQSWNTASAAIVADLGKPTDLIIRLTYPAKSIIKVIVQAQVIAPADYELKSDGVTLIVKKSAGVPAIAQVSVEYERL